MSDIRKWMSIVESVPGIFPEQPTKPVVVKKDATVMVHPRLGGGTGRYMHSTPKGAMIDIKGIARELTYEDFSVPERDYEDPYQKGNDWFHMTIEPETPGQQNDKPEFRPGDIVKVADVYGTVIGPGMGIFIAYSTSGQEGIVSFDNKEIVVPIANVGSAYEQNAKDQFNQMDNDGNLSTLSFGSDNVKVDVPDTGMSKEPEMDQRDEFSKWISAVEEALQSEGREELAEVLPDHQEECGCGNWDCHTCFPEPTADPAQHHPGIEFSGGPEHNVEPQVIDFGANEPMGPVVDNVAGPDNTICPAEEKIKDMTIRDLMNMVANMSSGEEPTHQPDGNMMGQPGMVEPVPDEVETEVPYNDIDKDFEYDESGSAGGMGAGGMAQSMEDAMEEEPMEEEPEHFVEKPRSGKGVKLGDITTVTQFKPTGGDNSPLSQDGENLGATPMDEMGPDAFDIPEAGWYNPSMEDVGIINDILSMQSLGVSHDNKQYTKEELEALPEEQLKACYQRVLGKTVGNDDGVDEMMTQYSTEDVMPESREHDELQAETDLPVLGESTEVKIDRPSLMTQLQWDQELREAFIEESTLSKIVGKEKGGQKLVQWLHRRHKLSNEADLQPAPFNERMLWKEFKANPDNFIIVAGSDGVAGIKPYKEYIDKRTKEFSRKGKTYNPGGDSTLPYQIIAFKDDGEQVDPSLLQPKKKDDGEEDDTEKYTDPTVMKARMGLHHGRDVQNPDNVFNLLADQIGRLQTVFVTKGPGVERQKMAKRAEKEPTMGDREAMQSIFSKVRPVLKKIGDQALSQINRTAQRYINGGNFEGAEKVVKSGNKLKQFLVMLDKSGDIALDTGWGSSTRDFSTIIQNALVKASGARAGTSEYQQWLDAAAKGNSVALKPVLDALRDNLATLA